MHTIARWTAARFRALGEAIACLLLGQLSGCLAELILEGGLIPLVVLIIVIAILGGR